MPFLSVLIPGAHARHGLLVTNCTMQQLPLACVPDLMTWRQGVWLFEMASTGSHRRGDALRSRTHRKQASGAVRAG